MKHTHYALVALTLVATLFTISCNDLILRPLGEVVSTPSNWKEDGIWIVGGCSGVDETTAIAQIDVFDPVTGDWHEAVTSLPVPVSFAAVSTGIFGGHRVLIVVGGFDATGAARDIVQRYDMDTDLWLANGKNIASPGSAPRANISTITNDNKLFIMGGTVGVANAAYGTAATTNYEYNIAGDEWYTRAVVVGGSEKQLASFDDAVYILGGRTSAAATSTGHEAYFVTPAALSGTTTTPEIQLATARTGHSVVIYEPASGPAVMLSLGGFLSLTVTPLAFVYRNVTGATLNATPFQFLRYPFSSPSAWVTVTAVPGTITLSRAFGAAAIHGTRVYYFGGTTSFTANGLMEVYSSDLDLVTTHNWVPADNMPVGRYGHAAVQF